MLLLWQRWEQLGRQQFLLLLLWRQQQQLWLWLWLRLWLRQQQQLRLQRRLLLNNVPNGAEGRPSALLYPSNRTSFTGTSNVSWGSSSTSRCAEHTHTVRPAKPASQRS